MHERGAVHLRSPCSNGTGACRYAVARGRAPAGGGVAAADDPPIDYSKDRIDHKEYQAEPRNTPASRPDAGGPGPETRAGSR
ncbi:hypothetical protein GCM10010177_64600 [Actinomadura citrea]|nr:hypothetical protein GCM10010177_64600 [Actinomadura citrea]